MGKQWQGLRLFSYFRIGYRTYLALAIGMINFMTTSYFIVINSAPEIKSIFSTFEVYVVVAVFVGVPIVAISGWIHFKKAGTYAAEAAIITQDNIYNYKWPEGYRKEVFGRAYLAILRAMVKRSRSEEISKDELTEMDEIETQLRKLIDGGYVGDPPKGAFR